MSVPTFSRPLFEDIGAFSDTPSPAQVQESQLHRSQGENTHGNANFALLTPQRTMQLPCGGDSQVQPRRRTGFSAPGRGCGGVGVVPPSADVAAGWPQNAP